MGPKDIRRRDFLITSAALPLAIGTGCRSLRAAPLTSARPREVAKIVAAQPAMDGAGVRLHRAVGSAGLRMLDPFLLLDEIRSDHPDDYIRGFPWHPHRGFETVTYMIHGAMEHGDSVGNQGHLGPGSIQWMTAGRGIVHQEMPKQERGLLWGFQLWVNLPAKMKMIPPRYQDIAPKLVPEVSLGDARVRVLAGHAGGKQGPVTKIVTAPTVLDVHLGAKATLRQPVPAGHTVFLYALEGEALLGAKRTALRRGHVAVLDRGPLVVAHAPVASRFLLFAGRPLGEPVARYGPFVMNTRAEIRQAVADYRAGRLAR